MMLIASHSVIHFINYLLQIILINFESMLSLSKIIEHNDPLTSLTKFNNSILGINKKFELIQIDTRDSSVDKITEQSYDHPSNIRCAKFLNTDVGRAYYFCHADKIETSKGHIIAETNKKAEFTQSIDGHKSTLSFSKYHHAHQKHSINVQLPERQKKIVRLFDRSVGRLCVLRKNGNADEIVYADIRDEQIGLIELEKYNMEVTFPKVSKFAFDDNYLFMMKGPRPGTHSSPPKKQRGSENIPSHYIEGERKVRVEAVQFDKVREYKKSNSCSIDFMLPSYPQKLETFRNDIIVCYRNTLEIYDIRKLVSSYSQEKINGISDFWYEPNLQKLYVSSNEGLRIFEMK